jgi:hypothetical protein
MDLELWICLNLKFSSQRFVVSDSTLGNFRRHLETKSAYQNRQTLEDSDIIHEELLIFDAFFRVANPNNLSFALSLGLPEPFKYNLRQVEIQDLNTDQMRKDYCIKWGKKLLDLKRSTQIISVLKNLPKNLDWNAKRDVFYLRRKAYFPFL